MARSRLLALAAGVGVFSAALELLVRGDAVASLLPGFPTYYKATTLLAFVGAALEVSAFGVAVFAFRSATGDRRPRLLAVSAVLFAASGTATLITELIRLGGSHSGDVWRPAPYTASELAFAAAALALVVTAGLVAVAVRSPVPRRLLAWACLALGVHFAFVALASGLDLAGMFDTYWGPLGGQFYPLIALGAGACVSATASVKAAIAFSTGASRRDRELGTAAVIFALGFAISAVGPMLLASSVWQIWLTALSELALAGAAAVGAAAFFEPSRAAQPS